ncbi:hypothetical protein Jiend_16400 [Micromonospora endophytica]|nr:hypothetical protein Jiend_16400 [Micromonospora endophytica]
MVIKAGRVRKPGPFYGPPGAGGVSRSKAKSHELVGGIYDSRGEVVRLDFATRQPGVGVAVAGRVGEVPPVARRLSIML